MTSKPDTVKYQPNTIPEATLEQLGLPNANFGYPFEPQYCAMDDGIDCLGGCWHLFDDLPTFDPDTLSWQNEGNAWEAGVDDSEDLHDTPEFQRWVKAEFSLVRVVKTATAAPQYHPLAYMKDPIDSAAASVAKSHPPLMQVATQDLAVLKRQEKLQQLNAALQGLWEGLNVTPRYAERVEPLDSRDDEIHFTFTLEEEDIADQLIRAARRAMASFGAEYWLPHYHPRAAQFRQEEHMQFKVRKSLIVSHLYWSVSFILCEPEEGYSLVEDHQP